MKNKLFAAFLAITTVIFFASSFAETTKDKDARTTQQPSKTKLLAHLKHIKFDIKTALTNTLSATKIDPDHYKEIENAVAELYALIAPGFSRDIILIMICTQIRPLQEMIIDNSIQNAYEEGSFEQLLKDNFIENHKQEIESILTKYNKTLTKYNKNNAQSHGKNALMLKERIADSFFTSPDTLGVIRVFTEIKACTILLQKIDAKIVELEAQL